MSDLTPDPKLTAKSVPSAGSGRADRTEPLACGSVRPSRRTSAVAFVGEPAAADDPLLGFAPYLHKQPRRNAITPDRQRAFVSALAANGIVTQAARSIGASLEALYKLRRRAGAEGFAAAWDEALTWGADRLEDCALERALGGAFDSDPLSGWKGRADALLIYLIRHRSAFRVDERDLRPGHPVYERLKAQWRAENAPRRSRGTAEGEPDPTRTVRSAGYALEPR